MTDFANPRPWSREEPCVVCGAGLCHSAEGHEDWCALQARINAATHRVLRDHNRRPPAWLIAGTRPSADDLVELFQRAAV